LSLFEHYITFGNCKNSDSGSKLNRWMLFRVDQAMNNYYVYCEKYSQSNKSLSVRLVSQDCWFWTTSSGLD